MTEDILETLDIERFTPDKDGVNHINVYSKAITLAGRKLTNFSHAPFDHPIYGHFESMEGFWFWLSSGKQFNKLRELSGFQANQLGQIVCSKFKTDLSEEEFKSIITSATKEKLKQNKDILQLLVDTGDLPIVHYYYDYQERDLSKAKVRYLKKHQWQMDVIMEVRKKTQDWMLRKGITNILDENF